MHDIPRLTGCIGQRATLGSSVQEIVCVAGCDLTYGDRTSDIRIEAQVSAFVEALGHDEIAISSVLRRGKFPAIQRLPRIARPGQGTDARSRDMHRPPNGGSGPPK